MFKLLKKLMLVGIVAGATVVAVKSTKVGGHVRHEVENVAAWAESQVPFERKIANLRKDVKYLDKDIDKAAAALAREIVEVRILDQEVSEQRAGLSRRKTELLARGKELTDAQKVGLADKPAPAADAKDRLKLAVTRYETDELNFKGKEKTLAAKERIKASLETQLHTLKGKKADLEAAIGAAEAKYNELKLARMESRYQNDDTRLSKIKQALRDLNKDLDIKAEELKLAPVVQEEGKPAGDAAGQSVEDILAPLTGNK